MTSLTDLLQPIKERLVKSTPGPWWLGRWSGLCYEDHVHERGVCTYKYRRVTDSEHFKDTISGAEENIEIIDHAGRNADLIANAPADLAKLIETVERLDYVIAISMEALPPTSTGREIREMLVDKRDCALTVLAE